MAALTQFHRQAKGLVSSRRELTQQKEYEAANAEILKGLLSYLKYLYTAGEISDAAYKVLVSKALTLFVENAISSRMDQVLNELNVPLAKASETLLEALLE